MHGQWTINPTRLMHRPLAHRRRVHCTATLLLWLPWIAWLRTAAR